MLFVNKEKKHITLHKISRGFNFAEDENFQYRVDLISQLRPS